MPGDNGLPAVLLLLLIANVPKSKTSDQTYLRFLNLVHALRQDSVFPPTDPVEDRMLNTLAARWHTGTKVTVLDVVAMLSEFSATTLHRRLKVLRKKGLIGVDYDDEDGRIKYVVPTKLTREYFSRLGDAVLQAAVSRKSTGI